jgi:NitT/TauT family transport system substrate-binding protein
MWKNARIVNSLLLAAVLALAGCSPLTTSPSLERAPLKVEWRNWEGDYTLLIASEKGFFAEHGVEVEPVYYETFSSAVPDLGMNRLDGGLFAVGDLLAASTATEVQGIAVYDSGRFSNVVSRQDIPSIVDLKGKKIGVDIGTAGELFVREMLHDSGMSINDVTLVDVIPEEVPVRLSEDLDAGYVWAPYDQIALKAGGKILYSRGVTGSLMPNVIVFRTDVIENRPEDVRAFLDAWFEALEYRLANPQESNQIIANVLEKTPGEVSPSGKVQFYTREDNELLFDTSSMPFSSIYYSAQVNLEFQVKSGSITRMVDLQTILNRSFLK